MRYRLVLIELATDIATNISNGFLESDAFSDATHNSVLSQKF